MAIMKWKWNEENRKIEMKYNRKPIINRKPVMKKREKRKCYRRKWRNVKIWNVGNHHVEESNNQCQCEMKKMSIEVIEISKMSKK